MDVKLQSIVEQYDEGSTKKVRSRFTTKDISSMIKKNDLAIAKSANTMALSRSIASRDVSKEKRKAPMEDYFKPRVKQRSIFDMPRSMKTLKKYINMKEMYNENDPDLDIIKKITKKFK